MYSLPIHPYADYWRASRTWGTYLGGVAVLLVSNTAASALGNWAWPAVIGTPAASPTAPALPPAAVPEPAAVWPKTAAAGQPVPVPPPSRLEIVDEAIPVPVQVIESAEVLPGMKKVQQAGEEGLVRKVIRTVQLRNGDMVEKVASFELRAPKKRVVIQNSSPVVGEKFDLNKLSVARTLDVEATAYTYTGSNTASGVAPRLGLIAVDPQVIPLGSRLYVEGYGYAIAADTGGDIKGNKIDVFFPSLRQCLDWGRRPTKIFLLTAAAFDS